MAEHACSPYCWSELLGTPCVIRGSLLPGSCRLFKHLVNSTGDWAVKLNQETTITLGVRQSHSSLTHETDKLKYLVAPSSLCCDQLLFSQYYHHYSSSSPPPPLIFDNNRLVLILRIFFHLLYPLQHIDYNRRIRDHGRNN
jgi:hypothetical protein